jgi:predicted amidohydrolase YtcJ
MKFRFFLLFSFSLFAITQLSGQSVPATIRYTASKIYTADTNFSVAEAIVVEGSKIRFVGSTKIADSIYPQATRMDYPGKYIYPSFIDAHTHLLGYSKNQTQANLFGCKSVKAIIKKLKTYDKTNQQRWIIGRGWDQNSWQKSGKTKTMMSPNDFYALNRAFPNKPVCVSRVDGHAVWLNAAAIRELGLEKIANSPNEMGLEYQTSSKSAPVIFFVPMLEGGEWENHRGSFTGVCIDKCSDWIQSRIPELPFSVWEKSFYSSISECHKYGITGIMEAGLDRNDLTLLSRLYQADKVNLRIFALRAGNEQGIGDMLNTGIGAGDEFSIRGVKLYLDGALGSRGALLKHEYCDHPGHHGLQVMSEMEFLKVCYAMSQKNIQVAVHAIGDSANAIAIRVFHKLLPYRNDLRWRIEHAQVVDRNDLEKLKGKNVIASVQPTHATSDAPWAADRLCGGPQARLAGAYAYKSLMATGSIMALGTDFPVESMNPMGTFVAATLRKDLNGKLKQPFLPQQALSPEETLWGMTLWAAYASFADPITGSLEPEKSADMIIMDTDIIETARVLQRNPTKSIKKLTQSKVITTIYQGKTVY